MIRIPCNAENVIKFVYAREVSFKLYVEMSLDAFKANSENLLELAVKSDNQYSLAWIFSRKVAEWKSKEREMDFLVNIAGLGVKHVALKTIRWVLSHHYPLNASLNNEKQHIFQCLILIGQPSIITDCLREKDTILSCSLYLELVARDKSGQSFLNYAARRGYSDIFIAVSEFIRSAHRGGCILGSVFAKHSPRHLISTRATYSRLSDSVKQTQSDSSIEYTDDSILVPELIKNRSTKREVYDCIINAVGSINYSLRSACPLNVFGELIKVCYIVGKVRRNRIGDMSTDLHRQDFESLMFAADFDPIEIELVQHDFREIQKYISLPQKVLSNEWIDLINSCSNYSNCVLYAAVCFGRVAIVKYILALQMSTVDLKSKEAVLDAAIGVSS